MARLDMDSIYGIAPAVAVAVSKDGTRRVGKRINRGLVWHDGLGFECIDDYLERIAGGDLELEGETTLRGMSASGWHLVGHGIGASGQMEGIVLTLPRE